MPHAIVLVPAPHPAGLPLPYPLAHGRAGISGFPSPAQDYEERTLDLNQHLVRRPTSTFFMKVEGDSMEGLGIRHGDLLVVDRAIEARAGHVLVAMIEGEITIKRYAIIDGEPYLCSANPHYAPVPVADRDCQVWGVVTTVIHELMT